MKNSKQQRLECGEILDELRHRVIHPANKSNNKTKFANSTPDELFKQLNYHLKVLYGFDDRQDLYSVIDPKIQNLADSVVSLIKNDRLDNNGNGTYTIKTQLYAEGYNLCSGERFEDQPIAPFCSGFLVAPDIVATAGHCIDGSTYPTINFVFGFRMTDEFNATVIIPDKDIYRGTEIIAWELDGNSGADYALVRLDRPVLDRPVVPVRRTGKIEFGEEVFVIGHPSGLPLKYTAGGKVNGNSELSFFEATVDTYGGNSGSPVFNQDGVVEGILVRGEQDYKYDSSGGCYISNQVDENGVLGEDITRSTKFANLIVESDDKELANSELDISNRVDNLECQMNSIAKNIEHIKNSMLNK